MDWQRLSRKDGSKRFPRSIILYVRATRYMMPTYSIPLAGRDKNKTCQSAKTRAIIIIIIVFIVRGRGAYTCGRWNCQRNQKNAREVKYTTVLYDGTTGRVDKGRRTAEDKPIHHTHRDVSTHYTYTRCRVSISVDNNNMYINIYLHSPCIPRTVCCGEGNSDGVLQNVQHGFCTLEPAK